MLKNRRRTASVLLIGAFLLSTFMPTFLSAVPLKAGEVSPEMIVENSQASTIRGKNFSLAFKELVKLTKEDILEKGEVALGNNLPVSIDEADFKALKEADQPGIYPLAITGEGQTLALDVQVVNPEEVQMPTADVEKAQSSEGAEGKAKDSKVTEGIVVAEENGINPLLAVTDGAVTIDVPDYVEANGWKAGDTYDVLVRVNFGESTSSNKKIAIQLPTGMRYESYPVTGTPVNIQVPASGVLRDFIVDYTIPDKTLWSAYNGTLNYEFVAGAQSVEIPFKVSVDFNIYAKPITLTDGIKATATTNAANDLVGETKMAVSAIANVTHLANIVGGGSNNLSVLAGDNVNSRTYNCYRAGDLYGRSSTLYAKKITQYVYYPVGFTYVTSNQSGLVTEVNDAAGYVKFEYENKAYDVGINITLSSAGLAPGVYTSTKGGYTEFETYNGELMTSSNLSKLQIEVKDSISNKLVMEGTDGYFYDYSPDYQSNGPVFKVTNDGSTIKKNQWFEVKIPTDYMATEVKFGYDKNANGGNGPETLWYTTNLNSTPVKAGAGQVSSGTSMSFVNQETLGLGAGEYIASVKVALGEVSAGFLLGSAGIGNLEYTHILGRLKDGVSEVAITASTYGEENNIEEAGTRVDMTKKVIRTNNPKSSHKVTTNTFNIVAGQTSRTFVSITTGYLYQQTVGMVNPTLYLKVPEYITISNPQISGGFGTESVTLSAPYTTSTGDTFVKIMTHDTKVGAWFNGKNTSAAISFDVTAEPQAKGANYFWSDILFVGDEDNTHIGYNAYPSPITNRFDVDNDGNLGKTLLVGLDRAFNVSPNEALIIDTYITPAGEGRKPVYDVAHPATAVGFTPGTHADYTVDILNNNVAPAEDIITYIPVPKIGNDFGSNFQPEAFSWNMKLGSAPTLYVEDASGTDITASVAGNYEISYSTDASTAANYEGASYGTTFSGNATMIKATNISGMSRGERAYLKFDYVVDEDQTSIAASPEKLGAVNAFNPHYSFKSGGNIGALKGTMAGARLEIGQIKGFVFHDTNYNGIYESGTDSLLSGKTVSLYKKDSSSVYQLVGTTTTVAGEYSFDNLGTGDYQVDFSGTVGLGQKFTYENAGSDGTINSKVTNNGAGVGKASGVDPTAEGAKYISAGVIDYTAPTVDITKATTSIKAVNVQQPNISELLAKTIGPSYFETIKATADSMVWSSSDSTTVEVFGDGYIKGLKPGTATITLTVKDMFGATASDTIIVTVSSNNIPTIVGSNQTIELGSTFVPWTGITAADVEDLEADLIKEVVVNTVNTAAIGIYDVTYKVTDTDGNVATLAIKVAVEDTTAPVISITNNTIYVEKDNIKTDAQLITMAGVSATDLTAVTTTINQSAVTYGVPGGPYSVGVTAKDTSDNTATATFDIYVVDPITADDFTIALGDVAGGNFVTLADAKAYDVTSNPSVKAASTVTLKSAKPTTVGLHNVTFKAATGKEITVKALVTNEAPVSNEVVTAKGFSVKLSDVASADFVTLANAKGYDVTDGSNPVEIPVTLVSSKPTTVGIYTMRFETAGGGWAEVPVVVTNETPVANEAVTAKGFVIKLGDVAGGDFVTLANAKGYDLTDASNPVSIPVILKSVKPTTVGLHTARFETAGGAWAEVSVLVTNETPVNAEAVTASGFTVKLADVASADFVALANAKGYDVTDAGNPVAIPVTLKSAKPTTVGLHIARFETAGSGWAEVSVLVTNETVVNKEAVVAHNFAIALEDVASSDFVALAGAKGYDLTESNHPVEIPVTLTSEKPTTVGIHTVRFETAGGGWAEVMVYVGNAVNGNEVIMANDFEVDLKDMADADFVVLADAKAYDLTDPDNPVGVLVTHQGSKPANKGIHEAVFETAAGTQVTVNVRVIDSTQTYHVSANDIEMTVSELNQLKMDGKLEDHVLKKSEAKAWCESTVSGTENCEVLLDVSALIAVKEPTAVKVEVYALVEDEINHRSLERGDGQPLKAVTGTFEVSVIADPVEGANGTQLKKSKGSEMPKTGGYLMMTGSLLMVLAGIAFILKRKKREK